MTRTSMLKFGRATKPRRNLMCNKKLDEAVKVTKKPPESGTLKRSNDNLPKYEQLPSKKRNEIKRIDKSEEENTNDVEKNYSPVERVPIPAKPETIRCRRSTRERKPLQKFTFIPEVKIRRPRKDPASENVDECTACGKKGLLLCCEACPKAFHLKCITPSLKELPSGTWFCDECHNKEHDDVCDICGWGGELLCCDKCSLAYHLKCVNMEGLPEDEWICPKCLKPPYTPHDGPDDIAILKENFMQYGLCRLKRALTTRQTQSCLDLTLERLHEAFDTVRRLGLEQELVDVGFTTFKTRSRDRYDLRIPEFMKKEFSYMNTKAPWLPLVKAILGSKIKVVHTGVMISLPGSETQPYHMDGPHLNEKKHLPVVVSILVNQLNCDKTKRLQFF
mmetsp:Transcript_43924/g.70614  ORF Transcript_43924/g.70614 Transcript_43924/m.70614 type:complete len:391 (-) Transcript_43924:60-1232(-)